MNSKSKTKSKKTSTWPLIRMFIKPWNMEMFVYKNNIAIKRFYNTGECNIKFDNTFIIVDEESFQKTKEFLEGKFDATEILIDDRKVTFK